MHGDQAVEVEGRRIRPDLTDIMGSLRMLDAGSRDEQNRSARSESLGKTATEVGKASETD